MEASCENGFLLVTLIVFAAWWSFIKISRAVCNHNYSFTQQDEQFYYHCCDKCGKELRVKK